ncbi:MAG: UDP-glucose 4-epimerase GalE [Bdellovibrionales bacterium]
MPILVTGGAGYIGSHTVKQLCRAKESVVVLDNLSTGIREAIPPEVKFYEGSTGDLDLVDSIIKKNQIEEVIHFAADIVVPESISNPLKYYQNNTACTLNLLENIQKNQIKNFIFSSTAAVYGDVKSAKKITEDFPLDPINPYGRSKLFVEQILKDLVTSQRGSFNFVALRYFNVAGASPDGDIGQSTPNATHLIKVGSQAVLGKREKLSVFGTDYPTPDGTCVRDYIHVDDLADAHLASLEYLRNGGSSEIFNCGYGKGFSVNEIIRTLKEVSEFDFTVEPTDRRPGDPPSLVADNSKIQRLTSWRPKRDNIETICKSALNWEKTLSSRQ